MLDTAGLADYRNFTKKRIAYARYRVGSTYTKVYLSSVTILSSGVGRAALNINSEARLMTVNPRGAWNQPGSCSHMRTAPSPSQRARR
jgi:hypothetical protein